MNAPIVILNPTAGRGRARQIRGALQQAWGREMMMVDTAYAGHAAILGEAAVRDGAELVVAVGGDGTVSDVANGVLRAQNDTGRRVDFGIVPGGSGDDIAANLGVPSDIPAAVAALREGKRRPADVGRLRFDRLEEQGGERYFLNNAGVGFEAEVIRASARIRWVRGLPLYALATLNALMRAPMSYRVSVATDDEVVDEEAPSTLFMMAISNGARTGGGMRIIPEAEPDDGFLDAALLRGVSRNRALGLFSHLLRGTHGQQPEVTFRRFRQMTVSASAGLPIDADGDLVEVGVTRLSVAILPKALDVVVR